MSNINSMISRETLYTTWTSCRPRKNVIKETLQHSATMEDNMKKLKISGYVTFKQDYTKKIITVSDDLNMSLKFNNGKALININKITYEEQFKRDKVKYLQHDKNANLEWKMCAMGKNGECICALCDGVNVLSKIGMIIGYDKNGKKYINYIPIS
jgi:hypothetical protein